MSCEKHQYFVFECQYPSCDYKEWLPKLGNSSKKWCPKHAKMKDRQNTLKNRKKYKYKPKLKKPSKHKLSGREYGFIS